ncbi:MAG: glycosyltransferase [Clostridia bacterium]|nr:glycosyltransferase [Clostridia bacterium]
MEMKISVIVPVFNGAGTLERCLGSIARQTLEELEVIVVNDASTDDSMEIIESFAKKDSRFRPFALGVNSGISAGRNLGLDNAIGQYVAFVDCDDYLEPEMYEELYVCAVSNDADVVISDYYNWDGKIVKTGLPPGRVLAGDEKNKAFQKANTGFLLPFSWRSLFRRDAVNGLRCEISLRNSQDSLFNLIMYISCGRLVYLDKAFYHYIFSPGGIAASRNKKEGLLKELESLYNLKMEFYRSRSLLDHIEDLYDYTIQHTLVMLIGNLAREIDCRTMWRELRAAGESHMARESFKRHPTSIGRMPVTPVLRILAWLFKFRLYLPAGILIRLIRIKNSA